MKKSVFVKYCTMFFTLVLIVFTLSNCFRDNKKNIDYQEDSDELNIQVDNINEAVINADCDYWKTYAGELSGKLSKGQIVNILGRYNFGFRDDDSFDIYVQIETIDDKIKGYVIEQNLTYLYDIGNDLLFKNILMTFEYYYNGTMEEIFNKRYLPGIERGSITKEQAVLQMGHLSLKRLLITERHLSIAIGDYGEIYRIKSINRNDNIYTISLTHRDEDDIIMTIINGDSYLIIDSFSEKNDLVNDLINVRLIPYNKEKTEVLTKNIKTWVNENSND